MHHLTDFETLLDEIDVQENVLVRACGLQSDPLQDDDRFRIQSATARGRVYRRVA